MRKLFKLLSLLKLLRELRSSMRGHGRRDGYMRDGYGRQHYGHDYHPPHYGRPRKLKMKHVLRDLLSGRRY